MSFFFYCLKGIQNVKIISTANAIQTESLWHQLICPDPPIYTPPLSTAFVFAVCAGWVAEPFLQLVSNVM